MGAPGEGNNLSLDRAQFKKAATEFESFFLYYMLKTMRQAVPKSGLLDSRHQDTYLSLMDQEVANQAARRGGLGLAKALEKQYFQDGQAKPSSLSEARPMKETEKEGN